MKFARDDAKALGLSVGLYIRILVRNDQYRPNANLSAILEASPASKYSVSKFSIVLGRLVGIASERAKAIGMADVSSYITCLLLARQLGGQSDLVVISAR